MRELVAPILARGGDDRAALRSASACLTYGELRGAVLAMRETLWRGGIGPGDRVALHVPKGLAGVVAMLAVLAAGAAYAPLDFALKPASLARALDDLAPALLIAPAGRAPPGSVPLAALDETALSLSPARAAEGEKSAPGLAAVLYTSGTTGAPKGILLDEKALASFAGWGARAFGVHADDVLVNHAPLHFDLSIFDILVGLGARASLRVLDDKEILFPGAIRKALETSGATTWYSAPSALARLQARGGLKGVATLRRVLFAGEVFPSPALRRAMLDLPGATFANLYGPAETNVCAFHDLDAPPRDDEAVPIGRPCEHCEIRLIDEAGEEVADGATGEIVVAGPSVMTGYHGRPQATAETRLAAWRPDSYRTGDYAWRRADGLMMFAGRRDSQIKLRGRRIELLALEATLVLHPRVSDAAALAAGDALVAFLVGPGPRASLTEIGAFVLDRLPPHYAPDEIVWLDALPLLSNGKCDRERLRALRPLAET